MALGVDKHRPKKLGKLDFHKKQAEHLEKLVKSGDFPHLLVSKKSKIISPNLENLKCLKIGKYSKNCIYGQHILQILDKNLNYFCNPVSL